MIAQVECSCGLRMSVPTGRAGSVVECQCGRSVVIPSLAELQRCTGEGRAAAARPVKPTITETDHKRPSPREFILLLTSDNSLHKRISSEALSHFVSAFSRHVKGFEKTNQAIGTDVQAAVAIMPEKRKLIDLQFFPNNLQPKVLASLQSTLETLAVPDVLGGPVAFTFRCKLWGGSEVAPEFDFPFSTFFHDKPDSLDEKLMEVAGLRFEAIDASCDDEPSSSPDLYHEQPLPKPRPWWFRLKDYLFGGSTSCTDRHGSPSRQLHDQIEVPQYQSADGSGTLPPAHCEAHGRELSLGDLDRLIEQQPKDASLYGLRADLLRSSGAFKQAIVDYGMLISLQPRDARAFAVRGHTYCLTGQFKDGLTDFTKAIEIDPCQVGALVNRGMIYLELEGWDNAISDFTRANELVSSRIP